MCFLSNAFRSLAQTLNPIPILKDNPSINRILLLHIRPIRRRMLQIRRTRQHLPRHTLMLMMTNRAPISTTSPIAVAAHIHGQTRARLNHGVVFGQVGDWVGAVDAGACFPGER